MSNHVSSSSPIFSRRSVLGLALAAGGASLLGGRPASARQATPAANGAEWSDSILNRALVRGTLVTDETTMIATFADLERQTIATGVQRPATNPSEEDLRAWLNPMYALALPGDYGHIQLIPEARAFAGFGFEDVYQTAEIGDPPGQVALYEGRFDRESVIGAWRDAGYTEIESGDVAIWSLSEDDSFDFTNPVQKLFLSRHNNAAIIGDGLIFFTSTLAGLRSAVAAATGEAESLAANEAIAPVLAATPRLVTGAIVPGSSLIAAFPLEGDEDPDAIASAIADQMAAPQMPPVRIALIGITGGGPYPSRATSTDTGTPVPTPETARVEISLLTYSVEEAERAITVAGERLATMDSLRSHLSYRDFFASWDLSVAADAPVARLSLELGDSWPRIWSDLLFDRDLGFIG